MTTELFESRLGHWPLDAPPADYVLGHVRAVLPDRVLDDALIAELVEALRETWAALDLPVAPRALAAE